jgi:hypothetical protein
VRIHEFIRPLVEGIGSSIGVSDSVDVNNGVNFEILYGVYLLWEDIYIIMLSMRIANVKELLLHLEPKQPTPPPDLARTNSLHKYFT